jgi:hypothetical protein
VVVHFGGEKKIKTGTKPTPKTHFTHVLVLHFLRTIFKFPIEKNMNFFKKQFPTSALKF